MPRARRRDEVAKLEAELDEARPYLALAREIHDEVTRVATGGATVELLTEAIEAVPAREREQLARAIFDQLSPNDQWTIVERVFGDDEIRAALESERQERLTEARRAAGRGALVARARGDRRLDVREVAAGEQLTVGLFREPDVAVAVERGHTSASCARRLRLLAQPEAGRLRVIEDVFNPMGGYFVTGHYDEDTWRTHERLRSHSVVRIGSITRDRAGESFEPVLYAGGRADFDVDGERREGRLHVGYVMVGEDDVFSGRGGTP